MSEESPNTSSSHVQPAPNRGRGRGYHGDNTGRYNNMSRPRDPHYPDHYSRGGIHQENRGRGYYDNRGRGYHPQNRGRGHSHHFEHRGRGYMHHDRPGGYYQHDDETVINPDETLALLGVKDLRQHLEKLKLEGKNSKNLQDYDDSADDLRPQHLPRGGPRGRGRSSSRGRGRSEDRDPPHQRRGDEPEPEIYINDVYNIKVEMSTSTGRKTFKLDQEDRLSNLKHVPDYEAEMHPIRPTEYHRGRPPGRRGQGRGRGQHRGRGQISHNSDYEPRSERHENTFVQGEGYSRRGRARGPRNFGPPIRSRQFRHTRRSPDDSWESGDRRSPDDKWESGHRPSPVDNCESGDRRSPEETWDSGEPKTLKDDTMKHGDQPVIHAEEKVLETTQKPSDVPENEGVDNPHDVHERRLAVDSQNSPVEDELEHNESPEYYDDAQLYEDYRGDHFDENYECEDNENYDTTYYAEESEGYLEENSEAAENYDSKCSYEANQQVDDARASEVQNVDENNIQAEDINEDDEANEAKEDNIQTQEKGGNIDDKHHLQQTESSNDEGNVKSVVNEDTVETSEKSVKKTKDKKKKVRINAP